MAQRSSTYFLTTECSRIISCLTINKYEMYVVLTINCNIVGSSCFRFLGTAVILMSATLSFQPMMSETKPNAMLHKKVGPWAAVTRLLEEHHDVGNAAAVSKAMKPASFALA